MIKKKFRPENPQNISRCQAKKLGSKAFFRRLARKQKLMGLETEALLFEGCRFGLQPGTPDSRNCSSYS